MRMGMIGGGPGAFIGAVHRIALKMDGEFELVAGCFSASAEKSVETGRQLGLDPARVYGSYQEMASKERALPAERRIQAVSIVTPNHEHHGPAKAFLEAGVPVICDKPLTTHSAKARELVELARKTKLVFAVTHNYTGYPMVREARELVQSGKLGKLRKVYVEYLQGWLASKLEDTGQKQAAWRVDPARSGPGGAIGDIGTHAFNLVEHITGDSITALNASLHTFVSGRRLDDDAMAFIRLAGGATGTLTCSQVCVGQENALRIRLFGEQGGLAWEQEHPNDLRVFSRDQALTIRRPGNGYVSDAAKSLTRLPAGHPEGYLEAFACIYRAFARAVRGDKDLAASFPTVSDGLRGVLFIEAMIESSKSKSWVEIASG
jgi:predicted dehydrogenase